MASRLYGFTNSEVLYLETLRIAISMHASSVNQISDIDFTLCFSPQRGNAPLPQSTASSSNPSGDLIGSPEDASTPLILSSLCCLLDSKQELPFPVG